MMKRLLCPPPVSRRTAAGLLLLRVFVGAALALHGVPKMRHPFGWMPPGDNIPGAWQFLAACGEFFGGLALVVGLLTPLAALGVLVTMGAAAVVVRSPINKELAGAYFVVALALLVTGPGRFSLDQRLWGAKPDGSNTAE